MGREMSDDLVKRLRAEVDAIMGVQGSPSEEPVVFYDEAAALITRQQALLDRAMEASANDKARAERAEAEMKSLRKRLTPRPIRYAPKEGRLLIGVERPPMEGQTFFYDIVWDGQMQEFVTPFVHARIGATHFLDPHDMIGIVWPHEIAKQRAAMKAKE